MLTSTAMGAGVQFTLNHAFKIDLGVVPQHRALEDSSADAPGHARSGANRDTCSQVVRGVSDLDRPSWTGSRNAGRAARLAGPFDILTADGTVQGNSDSQCRIVHCPAEQRVWMQTQHMPAARTARMHGTQGSALIPNSREGASCWMSG